MANGIESPSDTFDNDFVSAETMHFQVCQVLESGVCRPKVKYENSAAAAPQTTPVVQEATPLPRTNRAPSQNSSPTRRQRQFQQVPSQNFDTAPQAQLPTANQGRLRSGGS